MAKTLEEYRSEGYKFPRIARAFSYKSTYIIFALIASLALGWGVLQTKNNLKLISDPLPTISQYQTISVQNTSGTQWALNFVKKAPPGETGWRAGSTITPSQPIDYDECNSFGKLPTTLLSTTKGQNNNFHLTVQVYAAGMAGKAIDQYSKMFNECWTVKKNTMDNPSTTVYSYSKGFFFAYGDSIIFVEGTNNDNIATMEEYYLEAAKTSLLNSSCNMIAVNSNDYTRNLYYDPSHYKGLWNTKKIETTVNLNNIPNPVFQSIENVTYMQQPESPLPGDFPKIPKKAPVKPTVPKNPDTGNTDFTKTISYQAEDVIGPGCGWKWTGAKEPNLAVQKLVSTENSKINEALQTVNVSAQEYVQNKLYYSRSVIAAMGNIQAWNQYVTTVQNVNNKWTWLNAQRDNIKSEWYNYVKDHNTWLNFDNEKTNAINAYNAQVDACNAQNQAVTDWDNKYGTAYQAQQEASASASASSSSASSEASASSSDNSIATDNNTPTATSTSVPSPVSTNAANPEATSTETGSNATDNGSEDKNTTTESIPPRPTSCTTTPVLPSIATQAKGEEPQPPTIPEDVTIPNSWPKIDKTPTVKVTSTDNK